MPSEEEIQRVICLRNRKKAANNINSASQDKSHQCDTSENSERLSARNVRAPDPNSGPRRPPHNPVVRSAQPPGMNSAVQQRRRTSSESLPASAIKILWQRFRDNMRNVLMRFFLGIVMIALFSAVIYLGPLAITFCILFIQVMCFHEIISLAHVACKANNIPFSRWLSWYFLITSDVYLFGESVAEYFGRLLAKNDFGQSFLNYHLLLSYSMYITGFVTFVINLKKRHYTKQFTMFGITHITLLMIVLQSHMMIKSMMQGIVWFLLPALLIICNDSCAYVFGFFFGQTPLIKVSPKKTWEGFVGGAVSTVIFGFLFSSIFARYPYMVCPVRYYEGQDSFINHCEPSPIFSYKTYEIELPVLLHKVLADKVHLQLFPFQLHAIFLSLFASLISPFKQKQSKFCCQSPFQFCLNTFLNQWKLFLSKPHKNEARKLKGSEAPVIF